MTYGPTLPISKEIHASKYRLEGEPFEDMCNRLSSSLSDNTEHRRKLTDIFLNMRFLPAGRVQTSIGAPKQTTPYNCLSGDTVILTKEYGAIKISEAFEKTVHLLDGNGDWVLSPILCHGEQTTYELTFKGGFNTQILRSTLEHGWVSPTGSVFVTKNLLSPARRGTKGVGKRSVADLRPSKTISDEFIYNRGVQHGIIYGDGTKNEDGFYIRICSYIEDTLKWFPEYPTSYPPSSNGDPTVFISKGKAWTNLKEFPKNENLNHDYLLGFIRGWCAADGCIALDASNNSTSVLCGDIAEYNWLIKWGPVVGFHFTGFTELASVTNFGERKKKSGTIRFRKSSFTFEDILLLDKKQKWSETERNRGLDWRVYGPPSNPKNELVYCPVVGTTHSFALACGVHSRNCFCSGTINDAFSDIMKKATEAGQTMRLGGGIGYDFSTLRPRGSLIKSLNSSASGPVSFMDIYDAVCRTISSSGHRRGAQMGVLRCLAGNTKVHTLNEGRVAIKDLVGKTPYLYVVKDGKIAVEKAACIFKTGEMSVINVHIDNDTIITCTPDHKFMLSSGEFVEAKDLKFGSSLMAFHKRLSNSGYYTISVTGTMGKAEHKVVYNSCNTPVSKSYHIHHIDMNPLNNDPSNLQALTREEHSKLHYADYLKGNQERVTNDRKGKTLEEWLGVERATQIRENMCKAKQKQAQEKEIWNKGATGNEYTNHYKNGFKNQYSSNHKVIKVEDLGEICEVFDVSMPTTHNFFVEEVCVHNCDHPDIEEFIYAKRNENRLTGFNISVAITDAFMKAVKDDTDFNLKWRGKIQKTVKARKLWDAIMRSTWDWAEPGVLFIDRMNDENNLWYCETIATTNPCSEQPLPPYGACLLGSFNLVKYVDRVNKVFAYSQFTKDIKEVVRAMDNIVDLAIYPLPEQETEAKSKRRMGLGVTGLANALEGIGLPYGSNEFLAETEHILETLRDESYYVSTELAEEKGAFPLFKAKKYLEGKYIQKLPLPVRERIKKYGIRNSHLTSIAPTGTISLTADNISSGIEPVYTYEYQRTLTTFDGPQFETVTDYAYREWGIKGRTANSIDAKDHINVLVACQKYVDSSCSKTCNVGPEVTWDEFKNIYMMAYDNGAKGCSTFRASGKRMGIFKETKTEYVSDEDTVEEVKACFIDPTTGQKECG